MVYGYGLPLDFLIDFAKKRNLIDAAKTRDTMSVSEMAQICVDAIDLVITEAGLSYSEAEHCNVKDKEKGVTPAIALSSNDPVGMGLPTSPPSTEVIERLRNVLGFDHQPKWMYQV